jgi:nucleotide-binding universal stress UspA family protein
MTTAQRGSAARVVVGVDGSEPSQQAVRWAAAEARRRNTTLMLIYSVDVAMFFTNPAVVPLLDDLDAQIEQDATQILDRARAVAAEQSGLEIDTWWSREAPAPALRTASRSASLLVVGATGRGTLGTALGSVTLAVASHAACPVVVVRGTAAPDRPVLVGVDGGPLSDSALAFAFVAAAVHGVSLRALHVWSDTESGRAQVGHLFDLKAPWDLMRETEQRALAERLAGWSQRYPDIAVERVVERSDPTRVLVERSARASLVVVATRGRGGFAGLLLGSTGLALIQRAACPVMLVGPEATPPP